MLRLSSALEHLGPYVSIETHNHISDYSDPPKSALYTALEHNRGDWGPPSDGHNEVLYYDTTGRAKAKSAVAERKVKLLHYEQLCKSGKLSPAHKIKAKFYIDMWRIADLEAGIRDRDVPKNTYGGMFGLVRSGGQKYHTGIDIFMLQGTPIRSIADCIILKHESEKRGGKTLITAANLGGKIVYIVYMHLHEFSTNVQANQPKPLHFVEEKTERLNPKKTKLLNAHDDFIRRSHCVTYYRKIKRGEIIGLSGSTGAHATYPHLHLEIRKDRRTGVPALKEGEHDSKARSEKILSHFINPLGIVPGISVRDDYYINASNTA